LTKYPFSYETFSLEHQFSSVHTYPEFEIAIQ